MLVIKVEKAAKIAKPLRQRQHGQEIVFGPDLWMQHYLDDGLICTLWSCSQAVAAPHLFELPAIVGCTFPSRYVYVLEKIILPCNGIRFLCKQKELKEAKLWMVNQFDLILLYDIMNWNISLRKEKKMACVNRQLSTTSSLTENWGPNMPLQAEDFPSVLKNIKAHMLLHHLNK